MPEGATPAAPTRVRRQYTVDLRELGRGPGAMWSFHRTAPAVADLRVELIGVPEGSPLTLDLRLESVMEGVYISGTVSAPLAGECRRCLDPISDRIDVTLGELYAYPDSTTEASTDAEEIRRIDGDRLDLEPAVRDAVVLALPLEPLCRDDCPGLCPTCGEQLADLPPGHRHETVVDPRWAGLVERFELAEPGDRDTERQR